MKQYYFYPLKNLNDKILVKHIAHFLMALENVYPKLIPITELKKVFEQNYDSIVDYLTSGKKDIDNFIIGDDSGWRINNLNTGGVQKLISRVVQEDAVLGQLKLQKRQTYFNKLIAFTTSIIALFSILAFWNNRELFSGRAVGGWESFFVVLTFLPVIFLVIVIWNMLQDI